MSLYDTDIKGIRMKKRESEHIVGTYGEWGAGGPMHQGPKKQSPGYPVYVRHDGKEIDHKVAWFIQEIDAIRFCKMMNRKS